MQIAKSIYKGRYLKNLRVLVKFQNSFFYFKNFKTILLFVKKMPHFPFFFFFLTSFSQKCHHISLQPLWPCGIGSGPFFLLVSTLTGIIVSFFNSCKTFQEISTIVSLQDIFSFVCFFFFLIPFATLTLEKGRQLARAERLAREQLPEFKNKFNSCKILI